LQQALIFVILLGIIATFILVLWLIVKINMVIGTLLQMTNANTQIEKTQEKIEQTIKEEITRIREEINLTSKYSREEQNAAIKSFEQSLISYMAEIANLQKSQMDIFSRQLSILTQSNEQKLEQMRETLEQRVKDLQKENTQKLDQMRTVVDEKLHSTLEQRLGESFKLVSERLELVHKGLGEMQSLASGVGDLKKVLTNVKTRGTWGEVQLGNILEDILTPDQYATNVAIKKGTERVEFAIRLPGPGKERDYIWLPIDAKFPMEDYQRLLDAYEKADPVLVEQLAKKLENVVKLQAKDICNKYIAPPASTDFAIMFLPTEGLYAEVLKRPGLFEVIMKDYRITIAGPTTLAALINSLSMGFRTLAIQKRSSEVWSVLGAVKTEFSKFGLVLEKTQKKLWEASNTIDEAARRSRVMERQLKSVEALPENQAVALLGNQYSEKMAADFDE